MKQMIYIWIALFTLSSCNSWLDVDLKNEVDEDKLFETEQGFIDALSGVYYLMSESSLYGKRLTFEIMDVLGQYYDYTSITGRSPYEKFRDYDYLDATVRSIIDQIWNKMYSAISGTNNILEWIDRNGSSVLSENSREQIRGEALALRAYLHFDLLRMFAPDIKYYPNEQGIPYNKEFGVSLPPIYTVAESMQQVINDLQQALVHLDNDPIKDVIPYELMISGVNNKNAADVYVARMNYYAVKALLARVYLTRGDKENAKKYAQEVIDSEKFRLLQFDKGIDGTGDAQLDVLFSDEHIFSLRNQNISEWSNLVHLTQRTSSSTSFAPLIPSAPYALYDNNNDDVRLQKWIGTSSALEKYTKENSDYFFPKVPMIKLSEMYLILAEAWYSNNKDKALEYINELRNSRIRNNVDWGYLTKDYILAEIKRDFIGEGQWFFTCKRLNMDMGDIAASNAIYVFPMPDDEIEKGYRD